MAKAIVLLSALCFLAIANFAVADFEIFDVEGKVLCDTCRLGFVTSLSDTIEVKGDHENDICEISLVNSPKEDCKEIVPEFITNRVVCSKNVGMHNAVRFVNPLFFRKDKPIDGCKELVEQMELVDLSILENETN
ncbi:hypothetical protein HAX54_012368 [Datura stramonium]|uniref:Uncharacterized protein n=1 Tax=Datura stramonium TaxID=4076 RepID=A0ABS8TLI1_DATST|nr:hypothetical protein [Datura stramonium]